MKLLYLDPPKPSLSIFVLRGLLIPSASSGEQLTFTGSFTIGILGNGLLHGTTTSAGPTRKSSILLIDIPHAPTTFPPV